MARKDRLPEIEREYGEPLSQLIPRVLNEEGSMEMAARKLGVHSRTIYRWCEMNGVRRRVVYALPDAEAV